MSPMDPVPQPVPRPGGGTASATAVIAGCASFALYLALGWVRYSTGSSGNYDLGIFSQAAQDWAAGDLPGSAIRSVDSLFADHFSPVTFLFGIGWAVWPDPRSLIVVQALAMGLAVALVALAATRVLPPAQAGALAVGAVLAKGMVSAASFDVHETALGTPLMAGLCWGLVERRPRVTVVCAAGLLLVKEDLGLTVAVAGAVAWWMARRRRQAVLLVVLGVAGFVVANGVVVLVSPDHRSPYLQFLLGATGNPQGLAGSVAPGGVRWAPFVLFALTAGVIGLRSPVALLAVPTLAWRAVSSNTSYWQTYFHYDALLVPIAAFALLDILRRMLSEPGVRSGTRARRAFVAVAVVGVGWAAGMGTAKVVSWRPWEPGRYVAAQHLQDASALVGEVPRGAPVVVQQDLGPAVLASVDVRMLTSTVPAEGRWVLLTPAGDRLGAPEDLKRAWLARQRERPGTTVTARGDVVLVRLPAVESVVLSPPGSGRADGAATP